MSTTPNTYPRLAQLSADYRRQQLVKTADLVDEVHAQLAERYGPLETFRTPARWPVEEFARLLRLRQQHAEVGNIYGQRDEATALWSAITIAALARDHNAGIAVTVADAESFMVRVRLEVEAAFRRVEDSRQSEFALARFLAQQKVKEHWHAETRRQERDKQVAELSAVKQRLEALTGTAS